MQTVVSALEAAGSDVLLSSPIPTLPGTTIAKQATYVAALHGIGVTNHNANTSAALPFVDNFTAWQTWAISNANGWRTSDGLHATNTGYQAYANAHESALIPTPARSGMNMSPWNLANPASILQLNITTVSTAISYPITGTEGLIRAANGPTFVFPTGITQGTIVAIQNLADPAPLFTAGAGSALIACPFSTKLSSIVTFVSSGTYWYCIANTGATSDSVVTYSSSSATATGIEGWINDSGGGTLTIPSSGIADGTHLWIVNTSYSTALTLSSAFRNTPAPLLPYATIHLINNGSYWDVAEIPLGISSATTTSIGGGALAAGAAATGTVAVVTAGSWWTQACFATPYSSCTPDGSGIYYAVKCELNSATQATVKVIAPAAGTPTACTYNVRVLQ
jgi:hypothetical protein